jgi:dipeptidase
MRINRSHAVAAAFMSTHIFSHCASACTNFLITRGASTDGSVFITYSADSHTLYGELYHWPAAKYLPGTKLKVYEWDTGKYLGEIDQVAETFNVIGNMNEHQVAIGETTFGGRKELSDPKAIMDYGSLMYIALQRAKTAREAIQVITDLVAKYGYYSSGESMSISDANEAWFFEIIGKGPNNKGAVWVARRIPDGYISGHANAARIRQFPLNDSENTIFSPDVISFAREQGWFEGKDADFSFADVYNPLDFGAVRFCDARVWCMFCRAAPSQKFGDDWVQGDANAVPLPLWIKPDKKISVHDVMEFMRDHYEGTALDMTKDFGAGPYDLPYRWRPLTWKVGEQEYFNERATSTQQTGFSFVAQSRSWLPGPIGGVLWFGVDDTFSTVYVPQYGGNTRVPHSFAVGTGSFRDFSWDSAFWVFNFVSNYAYLRYSDMIKDVQIVQRELEAQFMADQPSIDSAAKALHAQSPRLAVEYLTEYSTRVGDETVKRWKKVGEDLLFKYLDGNVKDEHGHPKHPGYPKEWYDKVAAASGDTLTMRKLEVEKKEAEKEKAAEAAKREQTVTAIFTLLSSRSVILDEAARTKIKETKELKELQALLVKAASAESPKQLFASN